MKEAGIIAAASIFLRSSIFIIIAHFRRAVKLLKLALQSFLQFFRCYRLLPGAGHIP